MDLFRKIDITQLTGTKSELKKSLKTHNLVFLGIGAIIGTGIFVLTGLGALTAGPALSLSFLIAAVCCGFAGLCYAEFACMAPVSGSAYTYAYISFGEFIAFIMGWDILLEYGLAVSSVAVGWSGYFQSLLAGGGIHLPQFLTAAAGTKAGVATYFDLPAALIILFITACISLGINQTKRLNDAIVVVKLTVIITFILATVWFIKTANWQPFAPYGWYSFGNELGVHRAMGIIPAAAIVFFAFIGFDAISSSAEETIDPVKSLPKGILGSLLVASTLYIIMTLIMTGVVPYKEYGSYLTAPIMAVIKHTGQVWLGYIVSVGAILGITSVLLVMLYGQTRVLYAMSRDGLLPPALGEINKTFKTPLKGTWTLGIITASLAGLVNLKILAEIVNIGTLFAFILVAAGVMWMRRTHPHLKRHFRVPGVPLIPLLSIAFCLLLVCGLNWQTWICFAGWLALGATVFFTYGYKHSKLNPSAAVIEPTETE